MRENKPMKLLSVAIPCYNSAAYMRNCIESLLPGGDEVEILIVDDGSTRDLPGDSSGKRWSRRGRQCGTAQCDGRLL